MILETLFKQLTETRLLSVSGLRGASPAWLASQLVKQQPCCIILPDEHLIPVFEQDLNLFTGEQILTYPGHEIPPYTPLSPDQRIAATRLSTLYRLKTGSGSIMITSIEALLRRIMPEAVLTRTAEYLLAGEDCDQGDLLIKLQYLGYEKVALAQSVGDFSVRGGIIDIFPPPFALENGIVHEGPVRLDFFGDTIESLRPFDPFTQRSTGALAEVTLLPVTDILLAPNTLDIYKKTATLFHEYAAKFDWDSEETARIAERIATGQRFAGMEFFLPLFYHGHGRPSSAVLDFVPKNATLLLVDPQGINQSLNLTLERIYKNYAAAGEKSTPALPPAELFVEQEEILKQLSEFRQVLVTDFTRPGDQMVTLNAGNHHLLRQ